MTVQPETDPTAAGGWVLQDRDSSATGNRGLGIWVMGKGVVDSGGNRGVDNLGVMDAYGRPSEMMTNMAPLIQCRIGMMGECR